MGFREYRLGAIFFGFALSLSMTITLFFPGIYIVKHGTPTEYALDKQLSYGKESAFSYSNPLLLGTHEPVKVTLRKDPVSGQALSQPVTVYVYRPGDAFPSTLISSHSIRILGEDIGNLSIDRGKIGSADEAEGAVFGIGHANYQGKNLAYIENLTVLKGWKPDAVLRSVSDSDQHYAAQGRTIFEREQCWWCHTLLPEETQDWQTFGRPPLMGDENGQSPTTFGSDRKAPDLLHVGSRNTSREWMVMHLFNPRLVQPHSIMPRYDYLWGDKDANGNKIDFAGWRASYLAYFHGKSVYPPEVPLPAKDSEARKLIDFLLDLK